jgi:hypothetical protein
LSTGSLSVSPKNDSVKNKWSSHSLDGSETFAKVIGELNSFDNLIESIGPVSNILASPDSEKQSIYYRSDNRSDSPITISNYDSNSNSDNSDNDDSEMVTGTHTWNFPTKNVIASLGNLPNSVDTARQFRSSSANVTKDTTEYSNNEVSGNVVPGRVVPIKLFTNTLQGEQPEFSSSPTHCSAVISADTACPPPQKKHKYKNLTFHDVEQSLSQYYSKDNKFSSEFDILATYLKGQKNIYIQSKIVCQWKLNILTIPALILTAAVILFAPFTEHYDWGGIFISAINAVIALLLSMISYFKIESALEMYIYLTKQYEKMELSLELTSNKLLFIEDIGEQEQMMLPKIREIENKISDIKESHLSILIPEEVKQIFPVICHINILSFIKKIEVYKRNLIIQFKDIKNEIRYIRFKTGDKLLDNLFAREKMRLDVLIVNKDKIRDELLHYKNAYGHIDEIFTREIKHADYLNHSWFCCRKTKPVYNYSNPVITELLYSVFGDE